MGVAAAAEAGLEVAPAAGVAAAAAVVLLGAVAAERSFSIM